MTLRTCIAIPLAWGWAITSCDQAGPAVGLSYAENIPAAVHRGLAPGSVVVEGTEGTIGTLHRTWYGQETWTPYVQTPGDRAGARRDRALSLGSDDGGEGEDDDD